MRAVVEEEESWYSDIDCGYRECDDDVIASVLDQEA
jgi:hypothetical protein